MGPFTLNHRGPSYAAIMSNVPNMNDFWSVTIKIRKCDADAHVNADDRGDNNGSTCFLDLCQVVGGWGSKIVLAYFK